MSFVANGFFAAKYCKSVLLAHALFTNSGYCFAIFGDLKWTPRTLDMEYVEFIVANAQVGMEE